VIAAAEPGDAIVTLGAGSGSQAAPEILTRLRSKA
jgi:UDP-N-acetylmuramate-alanine ligase